jgi:hypothetical protein
MSSISVPSLALLVLQSTAPDATLAPVDNAPDVAARQGSAYAELVVSRDGDSPYAELEVPRVPWSHGSRYGGWDALDRLAELAGATLPANDHRA